MDFFTDIGLLSPPGDDSFINRNNVYRDSTAPIAHNATDVERWRARLLKDGR